jgi:predicted Zn-dependent protease
MLCSLQGKVRNYAVYSPPSVATNELTQKLVLSEYQLRESDPAKQAAAVETVSSVLTALRGDPDDYSPDYYADLAAKIALRLGKVDAARTIVQRGLQLQPDSEELGYLSRVLSREPATAAPR